MRCTWSSARRRLNDAVRICRSAVGGTGGKDGSSVWIVRTRTSPQRAAVTVLAAPSTVTDAAKLSPQSFSSRPGNRFSTRSPVMSVPNSRQAAGLAKAMLPCTAPQTASRLSRNSGAIDAPVVSFISISGVFPFRRILLTVSYHKFRGADTLFFLFLRSLTSHRRFLYIFTN